MLEPSGSARAQLMYIPMPDGGAIGCVTLRPNREVLAEELNALRQTRFVGHAVAAEEGDIHLFTVVPNFDIGLTVMRAIVVLAGDLLEMTFDEEITAAPAMGLYGDDRRMTHLALGDGLGGWLVDSDIMPDSSPARRSRWFMVPVDFVVDVALAAAYHATNYWARFRLRYRRLW